MTDAAQEPPAPASAALCVIRPSLPTARLTRSNSFAMPLVQLGDLVQGVGDLAGDPGLGHWHAHREVALPDGGEHGEQLFEIEAFGAVVRA